MEGQQPKSSQSPLIIRLHCVHRPAAGASARGSLGQGTLPLWLDLGVQLALMQMLLPLPGRALYRCHHWLQQWPRWPCAGARAVPSCCPRCAQIPPRPGSCSAPGAFPAPQSPSACCTSAPKFLFYEQMHAWLEKLPPRLCLSCSQCRLPGCSHRGILRAWHCPQSVFSATRRALTVGNPRQHHHEGL